MINNKEKLEEIERISEDLSNKQKKFKSAEAKHMALQRLLDNEDFQLIVLNGYLHDEIIRLVQNQGLFVSKSIAENLEWAKAKDNVMLEKLKATNYFKTYLDNIENDYERLKDEISNISNYIEESIRTID